MATTKKFRVKHGLDAGNNTISFVNDPVSANDAATKNYVDIQVAAAPGDVSNSYLTSTFTTNTAFQSYVANTNSRIDTLEAGGTLVTNSYLTSTFTTNTVFQSALANTNAYIASVESTERSALANTNLAIGDRIQVANATLLINDRLQVANADAKYATWTALTTSNTAIRSYVDTEVAALVNSAPTTLDTLNELAAALGDDPNFATTLTTNLGQKLGATASVTLTGDVTGSGSFSSNAVSIALTDTNLGNTNAYIASESARIDLVNTNLTGTNTALRTLISDRMQVANVTSYTAKYLEVANVASNTSVTSGSFASGNNTITFTRADSSAFDVVLTGVGEVTNAYVTSTYTTNTVFQSALANTNAYIATKTDDTVALATNTALRILISDRMQVANTTLLVNDRMQVANVTSAYVTNTVFQSALANTNAYIATKTDDTTVLATNTALRTLIDDRMQVANVQSYVATEIAALVNSAPTTLDTLDELAAALGDDANFSTTVLTLIGTKASNSALTSTYVTNTVFQSALANTNAYIATKTDDTTVLATNTALRTLIDDRVQVANLNTTLASYWPSANVITYTAKYLEVANNTGGASVTIQNTAPTITSNGDMWWDNSVGELYVAYANNWVEAVAQDVTPYANNGTFSSSNNTITFVRTDGSQFDVVLTGVGEVTNAYVSSTYTTNTVFQSALANTNAYIATKTDDTVALATNTALRTLISDRMQVANVNTLVNDRIQVANATLLINDRLQVANATLLINDRLQVANADSKYATWSSLTSTNTAIRAYVDTEVAALVNSAPTTLNTLDELAQALGDDANFATTITTNLGQKLGGTASITLTGDVTGSGSFSSNAVSIALTDTNLANTNAYIATKTDDTTVLATNTALRTLIDDRIQVANVTGTYVTNTVFQSALANTNAYIASVSVSVANTSTSNATVSGNTATFTRADSSTFTLDLSSFASAGATLAVGNTSPSSPTEGDLWYDTDTGIINIYVANIGWVESTVTFPYTGDVANSYLTSTYVANTTFQSFVANTNAYIATKTDDTVALATNTALRTLISDRMQVANVEAYLANTNSYIATESARIDLVNTNLTGTNTALRILISDRIQVANADAKYATWSSLTSTNTAIRSYVDTEVAALVNSAPTTLDTLNELAAALGDDPNFATTLSTNLSQKLGATASVTLTGDVTGTASFSANALSLATTDTNLGNTNARVDLINTNLTSTNTALRTLISDRMQVANVTSTYVTNTVFQSALANTNSYIATKTDDTTVLATNTALRTLINDRVQVANLNTTIASYWPSANIITYTAKYLEVANSSSGTSLTVSNTAPTITANGELWWDNSVGELYVSYSNNWVEAVAQDITPYTNNVSYSTSNTTLTFTRTDASQFDVYLDLSGVSGEVSNSYLTSTFVTNTTFQSALANTNAYIATKTDDTTVLATNTALRTLISDRMQVANVEAYLANTNSYIATESARIDLVNTNLTGTNTALRTLISDRIQVANADSKYATWSSLTSTNTAIRAYVDTEVAALVNSAPTTLDTLDELAAALGDDANFSTTVLTLIGSKASNSALTSTYVTNTVFQSALANTNSYIATKTDDTVALATNTALRTLIDDRMQVANTTLLVNDRMQVANTTLLVNDRMQVANVNTLVNDRVQVANLNTTLASYWPSANVITYTAKYLEVANNTGGASVTVSTSAPSSPSEGDQWFDSEDAIMYIYYDSHWVEVQASQQTLTPYEVNVDTFTANGTATSFGHTADVVSAESMIVTVDGVIQRPTTDYTVSSNTVTFGSAPANTSIVAIRVTTGAQAGISNATFQSALANTNAYIASTAATEQTNLANTNAYIATKLSSANSFSAVTVSGGNTILTTTTGTELNIVAGNNMIIDANDTTKTLTISSSASGGGGGASTGTAIAMALIFG